MPATVFRFTVQGEDAVKRAYETIGTAADRSGRKAAQAAKAAESAEKKAAQSVKREAERASKAREREADKASRVVQKQLDKEVRAHERAVQQVKRIRDRHFLQQQRQQERLERSRSARIAGVGSSAAGLALRGAGAAGAVGLSVVAAAVKKAVDIEKIASNISAQSLSGGVSLNKESLISEFASTAQRTPGQTVEGIALGAQAFQSKTGNIGMFRTIQNELATIASASGAEFEDVSRAAADLFEKFDIKSVEGMKDALSSLSIQGQKGSFELKDAAAEFGRLSAAAAAFGFDKGAEGVKLLGGLTQVARSGTGSAPEAATAVDALLRQLGAKSGDIEKLTGKKTFDKTGKARNPVEVIGDMLQSSFAAGPDKAFSTLQKLLGDEGFRAVKPMLAQFNAAAQAAPGTNAQKAAAGLAAFRAMMDNAIVTTGGWDHIVKQAGINQQSTSARLSAEWEKIVAVVSTSLLPNITQLAANIGPLATAFSKLVGVVAMSAEGYARLLDKIGFGPSEEVKNKRERADILKEEMGKGPLTRGQQEELNKLNKELGFVDQYASKRDKSTTLADAEVQGLKVLENIEKAPAIAAQNPSYKPTTFGPDVSESQANMVEDVAVARMNGRDIGEVIADAAASRIKDSLSSVKVVVKTEASVAPQ